jgi:hypothetical protein
MNTENKIYKIIIWVLALLLLVTIYLVVTKSLNKYLCVDEHNETSIPALLDDEKEEEINNEDEIEVVTEQEKGSNELVRKEDRVLYLKLDNGKEKIIPDVIGEDDTSAIGTPDLENNSGLSRFHTYNKLHEDINYYGINVRYNAGSAYGEYYLLVNKANGNQVGVDSDSIVLSPDKQRLVSYSDDLSGFNANGFIVLVKGPNGGFETEYETDTKNWGPYGARWISNTEIEFDKHDFSKDEVTGFVKYRLKKDSFGQKTWEEVN